MTSSEALELIASRGCVCRGRYCRHLKWLPRADWCSPCIAAEALAASTPSPQADLRVPAAEDAPPGPHSKGDACGPGGPNVPS